MTQDTEKKPEQLEAEIEQTRARIGSTVDAIQAKLSPGQVVDQVMGYFRGGASEYASNLGNTLKQNPVPVALTGLGLAWLMMSGSSSESAHRSAPPRYRTNEDYLPDWAEGEEVHGYRSVRYAESSHGTSGYSGEAGSGSEGLGERISETAAGVRDKVSEAAAGVGEKIGETAGAARTKLSETAEAARARAGQAADTVRTRTREAAQAARHRATQLGQDAYSGAERLGQGVVQTVKQNPVPIALIGAGVAWLLISQSSASTRRSSYPPYPRYQSGEDYVPEWAPQEEEVYGAESYLSYPYDPYREDVYASESYSGGAEGDLTDEDLESSVVRSDAPSGKTADLGARLSETATGVRDKVSETASSVGDKLSEAAAGVRDKVSETASSVGDKLSEAAAGARDKVSETAAAARARLGETAQAVRTGTRGAAQEARYRAQRLSQQARYGAQQLGQQTRYQSRRAQEGFNTMLEEQPLVLVGIGIALGAVLGSALPITRREDELMGETRDEMLAKAKQLGEEQYHKAQAVATAVMDSARQEAERQQLTPEAGKDVVRQMQDKIQRVAEVALDSVKQEAERQQITPQAGEDVAKQMQDKIQRVAEAAWEGGKQESERQGLKPSV